MTIDPEMLAAYADGELGAEEMAQVEAAMEADPAIAAQIEAHLALRAQLQAHFAPILEMPVPGRLTAAVTSPAQVIDFTAARRTRAEARNRWMVGGLLAASLALGLVIGTQLPRGGGSIASEGGRLIASGALDKALTSQLAAEQSGGDVRILLSFRDAGGRYCRGFEQPGSAGIACQKGTGWAIERMQASDLNTGSSDGYRQAGSAERDIMEAAQNMALDGALDATDERAARDAGWRH